MVLFSRAIGQKIRELVDMASAAVGMLFSEKEAWSRFREENKFDTCCRKNHKIIRASAGKWY